MLSPEVVNFALPNVVLQSYSVKNEEVWKRLSSEKHGEHFHGLTAILPCNIIPTEMEECLLNSYYQVEKFPVYKLLEPDFLLAFIKNGHLDARVIGAWPEVDQFAVLDSGKLYLSVNKDVYQELGLNAKQEQIYSTKKVAKYCVTLDLLDAKLLESLFYQKVIQCLKNHTSLQFDWLMIWQPHDPDICPSSLAAFLDLNGFQVVQCHPLVIQNCMKNTLVPLLSPQTDLLDITEWVGATALNMNCSKQENYTSSLCCPEPNCTLEEVHILRWKGFFTSRQSKFLLDLMFEILKQNSPPWLNLTFHGFDDFQTAITRSVFITSAMCKVVSSQRTKEKIK